MILAKLAQTGQNVRQAYQRPSLVNPSKDYYFMQRNTGDTESVTIEYGFLDSKKDDVYQLKNNWQKYAEAAVQAILEYIKYGNLEENMYIVKAGDSLYSIAQKYNVSVNDIKRLNNLTSDNLSIGQRLKVPIIYDTNYYLVKKGDTLYSIAEKHNMSVLDLKKMNNLTSNDLYIGQKLNVNKKVKPSTDKYIVTTGDTLYSISKKFNIPVDSLKQANNISNNLLIVGQELIIPNDIYIVTSGDNLYSIATKFNTTVSALKSKNNLTNDNLYVGQKLII